MSKRPIILVAPLNWGLGHASRIIPIIKELKKNDAEIIIGADGDSLSLLRSEFPELEHIVLPDIKVSYNNNWVTIAFKTLVNAIKEHKLLKRIIKNNFVDVVISDNRYGLFNKSIVSILVTHQTTPILPNRFSFFSFCTHFILKSVYKKFNRIWIPDLAQQDNLSGKLSHSFFAENSVFINPLSHLDINKTENKKFDFAVVLSGPEPYRTDFENIIIQQSRLISKKLCLVRGSLLELNFDLHDNITVFDFANSQQISKIIAQSDVLICRAGYSSIMDIWANCIKAVIVPTPKQPEQLYLAELLTNKGWIHTRMQDNFNLSEIENLVFSEFNNNITKDDLLQMELRSVIEFVKHK